MGSYHLAQINVAHFHLPTDDPRVAEFMALLDGINALADESPGFVSRTQDDGGNATGIDAYDDPRILINMSVWESVDALFDFTYKSTHTQVMGRRKEWFEKLADMHMALWWVPAGHSPTVEEGKERLEHIRRHGPTAHAFTFKTRMPAPDEEAAAKEAAG